MLCYTDITIIYLSFYLIVIVLSFDSTHFTTREGQDHVIEVCIVIEKGRLERNISITLYSSDINGEDIRLLILAYATSYVFISML